MAANAAAPILLGVAKGVVTLVPAALALYYAYNRYDGKFRDNVIFLFFIGGLLVGMAVALFGLYLLGAAPILYVIGMPFVDALAMAALLNRRKWQGQLHAIFNAGTLALGVAVTVAFGFAYLVVHDLSPRPLVEAL